MKPQWIGNGAGRVKKQSEVGAYLYSQPGLDELQGVRQDGRHHASCRPGQQRDGQAGERGVGPVHQGGERLLGDIDSEQLQRGGGGGDELDV